MFTFTIDSVSNLVWDNPEHTSFSCVVRYVEYDEDHNTGIKPDDPNTHIQEIWVKGIAGEYGSIAEYVPPPTVVPPPTEETSEVLAARQQLAEAQRALMQLLNPTNT